ncbi:MAG TPA: ADP-ribosylglycohydrolase family protein [Anaerolineae bacterium]|nr:ADP-ribosylglycohydrolase family protein [Anaerolineae bacterium]HPL29369.1 ADP-ribosylglycohydrolase family protein [Anaerolineae bacterium]
MAVTIERARGCLLGQAAGDALGAPIEGMARDRTLRHNGGVRDYADARTQWTGQLGRAHLPGLYTDDTQQALLIADVLVERRGFDADLARERYLELARPAPGLPRGAHRATGGTFRAALQRMAAGYPSMLTGVPSAGNGAAMRVAPIGLWYAADPDGLRRAAIEASLQTHADARGVSAAVAVAFLASYLATHTVAGDDAERAALEAAALFTRDAEVELAAQRPDLRPARFSGVLSLVAGLWGAARWDVLRAIVCEANRHGPARPITSPADPFAAASVATAIYLALAAPDFEQAVTQAVNLGGDADTVGAISGALAGARWGAGAIPQRWLDGLENRQGIISRADALAGGAKGGAGWEELPAMARRVALSQARVREGW